MLDTPKVYQKMRVLSRNILQNYVGFEGNCIVKLRVTDIFFYIMIPQKMRMGKAKNHIYETRKNIEREVVSCYHI